MTYLDFMNKSELALEKAKKYANKNEVYLALFWKNVSKGYKLKALATKVKVQENENYNLQ